MIKKLLKNKIPIEDNKITFIFSGRVAINRLAKKFKKKGVVLIPNYICNVVDRAFEKENYKIIRYELEKNFEPNIEKIIDCIDNNRIDILLFASLYGSGKFMNELNNQDSNLYKIISNNQIDVIIDFAQDFYRINDLNLENKHYHYIFSFNDKSFIGAMGAIVVSNDTLLNIEYKKMSYIQHIFLIKSYIIKILNCKTPWLLKKYQKIRGVRIEVKKKIEYEFSTCKTFPYTFENYRISNIQIFFALIGIIRLNKYYKSKNDFLITHTKVLKTQFFNTASYIISDDKKIKNRVKIPYSLYNNKFKSKYPNLKIFHNKGFCDK